MRLPWREKLKEESGYTLVETLVAMALFLSVLIPLGVAIGTLLLDREAEKIHRALLLAQREMSYATGEKDLGSTQSDAGGGFTVYREVTPLAGGAREVRISVTQVRKPARVLVRLCKTMVRGL